MESRDAAEDRVLAQTDGSAIRVVWLTLEEGGEAMTEDLLSIKSLAHLLECSPKTVRDWMYRSRKTHDTDPLPYYRLGGLVRFRRADVQAWIARRRVRPVQVVRGGTYAAATTVAKAAPNNL